MYGYIYKTTNLINGKLYIGKKKGNFVNSYRGSGRYLRNALSKYGEDNFSVEVLEYCDSLEHQNVREKYWIKYFQDLGYEMYNISRGGDGGDTFYRLSNNDRQKRLENLKQNGYFSTLTKEQRKEMGKKAWSTRKLRGHENFNLEKLSASLKIYYQSDEYKLKLAERHKKIAELKEQKSLQWISEKHTCGRCGKIMTKKYGSGKYCCKHCAVTHEHTQETKDKIAEMNKQGICGNKGKHLTQEHRDKIGNANKGKVRTNEQRQKLSDSLKGKTAWNKGLTVDDPRVAKYARKKGEYRHSEEVRKKIRENRWGNTKRGVNEA